MLIKMTTKVCQVMLPITVYFKDAVNPYETFFPTQFQQNQTYAPTPTLKTEGCNYKVRNDFREKRRINSLSLNNFETSFKRFK